MSGSRDTMCVRVPKVNVIMVMKTWKEAGPEWSHVLDAFCCNKATVTTDGADLPWAPVAHE